MNAKKKTFWFYVLLIIGSIAAVSSVWYFEKMRRMNAEVNMCSDAFCSINLSVDEKKAFAEEKDQLPIVKEYSEENVKELIEKVLFEKLGKNNILDELEKYGVYLLDKEIYHKKTLENKEIFKPHVFYSTFEQMWIVAFGGEWMTNDWNVKIFNGDLVGGINFGLKYSDKEGSYLNALEKGGYSWIGDGESEKKEGVTMGTIGGSFSGNGPVFGYHDYIHGLFPRKYVGEEWFGCVKYTKEFETFGGEIMALYEPAR